MEKMTHILDVNQHPNGKCCNFLNNWKSREKTFPFSTSFAPP